MTAVSGQGSGLPILPGNITGPKNGTKTLTLYNANNEKVISGEIIEGFKDKLLIKSKKVTYFDPSSKQEKTVYVKVNTLISDKFKTSGKQALKSLKEVAREAYNQNIASKFERDIQTAWEQNKEKTEDKSSPQSMLSGEMLEAGQAALERRKNKVIPEKKEPSAPDITKARTQADVNAWIKQRLASPAAPQPSPQQQAKAAPKQSPAPRGLANARTQADVNAWMRQKVAESSSQPAAPSAPAKQEASSAVDSRDEARNEQIEKKMGQLKEIEMNIPESRYQRVGVAHEKVREHTLLTDSLRKELVGHIEDHREEWLKEAADAKQWIIKKVPLRDGTVVKVEIFPPDRENREKLGLIDIRMEFVGSGSTKKVYRSLNYDTNKVRAGVYGESWAVKGDLRSDDVFKAGLGAINDKKKILVSKAHDEHTKQTKRGKKIQKSKMTQPLLNSVNLSKVLETRKLPDGRDLDEQTQIKLLVSAFGSLEQVHALNMVHIDIKTDNLVLKEVEIKKDNLVPEDTNKPKEYELRLIDYGLSEKTNTTTDLRGTPGYIAPEILQEFADKGTATYTVASDLYAMGVAFSDPANADPWWHGTDVNALDDIPSSPKFQAAAKGGSYRRLGTGQYSPKFQEGLDKLTNFDPTKRFKSAAEAKEFFQGLIK